MNRSNSLQTRLRRLLLVFIALSVGSVAGYILIERYTLPEAIYMTVITLSTVGFGEVKPLTTSGRVFTALVILLGVGTVAYTLGTLGEFLITGELEKVLRQRRNNQLINQLTGHYIVCGFGRVGQQVVVEMRQLNLPLVVIDKRPEAIELCRERGVLHIEGDATDDSVLKAAGVERAAGLLSVLSEDADNVFVVLSAREINDQMVILARASSQSAEKKLAAAGATETFSPQVMAGFHMVSSLLRPNAMRFIESAIGSLNSGMWVEEVRVAQHSKLVGQSLGDVQLRVQTGANVLAIIGGRKHELVNWSPDLRMEAGDILIVLGDLDQIRTLAELAGDEQYLQRDKLYHQRSR